MKTRLTFALVLTATMAFLLGQPLSAQTPEEDLEGFRNELAAYYDELADVYPQLEGMAELYNVEGAGAAAGAAGSVGDSAGLIAQAQEAIPELTAEDLARLRALLPADSEVWDLPDLIRSSFGQEGHREAASGPLLPAGDDGALFVGGVDGWGDEYNTTKLVPEDIGDSDHFGYSVDMSGDTLIVGAPYSDGAPYTPSTSGAPYRETAFIGDDEILGRERGAAYVFQRDGDGGWDLVQKLIASDAYDGELFGWSVAIDGDTAIVGAKWEGGRDNWDHDAEGFHSGSAYIFQRNVEGNWQEEAQLKASDYARGYEFGYSVDISGDMAIVGSPYHGYSQGAIGSGAAYVYWRAVDDNGVPHWDENRLPGPGHPYGYSECEGEGGGGSQFPNCGDEFGYSVAISECFAVVGAPGADWDEGWHYNAGAAFVYKRAEGSPCWGAFLFHRTLELYPPNGGDVSEDNTRGHRFGTSVALEGGTFSTLIVGAPYYGYGWEGHEGDKKNAMFGAAYVFLCGPDGCSQVARLDAHDDSNAEHGDRFGWSVALSPDMSTAVVGAPSHHIGGDGVPLSFGPGALYTFQRNEGGENNWGRSERLTPYDGVVGDEIGFSAAVRGNAASGYTVFAGAPLHGVRTFGFPSVSGCPDPFPAPPLLGNQGHIKLEYSVKGVAAALAGVHEAIPDSLVVVNVIAAGAWAATEVFVAVIEGYNEVSAVCELDHGLDILRDDVEPNMFRLDERVSTRASQESVDALQEKIQGMSVGDLDALTEKIQGRFDALDAALAADGKIQARLDALDTDLDALSEEIQGITEWDFPAALTAHGEKIQNRFDTLATDLADYIANIQGRFDALDTALAGHDAKTQGRFDTLATDLADYIANIQGRFDAVDTALAALQEQLDTQMELRRIHLGVIALAGTGDFLVSASEGGQPVDVEFIGVQASMAQAVSFVDVAAETTVTVPEPGTGRHVVEIALPRPLSGATLFEFRVRDDHGDYQHFGMTLFDTRSQSGGR